MADPQPPAETPDAAATARRRAAARWAIDEQDPNALRMVTLYICWRCYTGDCAACCYYGRLPGTSELRTDCACSRARHCGDWVTASSSTRMYALDGAQVHPRPYGGIPRLSTVEQRTIYALKAGQAIGFEVRLIFPADADVRTVTVEYGDGRTARYNASAEKPGE